MKRLTEVERLWANLLKAKRAEVRLIHSIAADNELAEALPELKEDFDQAVKLGVARAFIAGQYTFPELGSSDEV